MGNKAAVFPLQLLGFDVDVVNSVHFSNHTGYNGGVEGDVLKGNQLRDILDGLERNGLLANVGHILTGYIGSESFLEAVLDVVERVRKKSSGSQHVRYVCDPVLGDHGKFYVPVELVDVYKSRVIPVADVLTPNQFEVEQLTGISIETMDDAKKACMRLHEMGPSLVIITSLVIADSTKEENNCPTISIVASQVRKTRMQQTNGGSGVSALPEMWSISCPQLPGAYTGTGDLCAALFLAHTAIQPNDISGALEKVIDTMYAIIERTHRHSETCGESEIKVDSLVAARELQLIQSKREIENPPQLWKADRIQ